MWRSVSKFAMRPPLEERKWREICCFSSAWVTSFIKNRTNSAPGKNSELPSHAPSLGILPFFLQMSRPLLWTPKPEEIFVASFEGKLTSTEELLLWSATIRDGRNSLIAPSLSAMAKSKKRCAFYESIGIIEETQGLQQMGHQWPCDRTGYC